MKTRAERAIATYENNKLRAKCRQLAHTELTIKHRKKYLEFIALAKIEYPDKYRTYYYHVARTYLQKQYPREYKLLYAKELKKVGLS